MRMKKNITMRKIRVSAILSSLIIPLQAHSVSFDVEGTAVSVGGYAKLDAIYDFDSDLGFSVQFPRIALDEDNGPESFSNLHAFESRLNVGTSTNTDFGTVRTFVEGDFYGGGGGTLRLRHAYGEWNGILAGQTWTNFGGFIGLTPTIDFTTPTGNALGLRQAQIRYTTGQFSVSLEDPGNLGGNVVTSGLGPAKSTFPDLTARYETGFGALRVGTSTVLRQLEYYNSASDDEQTKFGWGVHLEGAYDISDALTVRASFVHGDGIGGYINVGPNPPAYVDETNNEVETITSTGVMIGATYKVGPGAVNIVASGVKADIDDAVQNSSSFDGSSNEQYRSYYANYIWTAAPKVTFGVELGHHSREVYDGRDGAAMRVQAMAKYSF